MAQTETKTTFTPGPWEVQSAGWQREIYGNRTKTPGEPDAITSVATVEGNPTSQIVTTANARLIAAAPNLFAACEKIERVFAGLNYESEIDASYFHDNADGILTAAMMARAAIEKAAAT